MIIQTFPADRNDGGTDFIGPCGRACQSIGVEGTVVEECPLCRVKVSWAEYEIHCKDERRK